jgi:hypothetical protein
MRIKNLGLVVLGFSMVLVSGCGVGRPSTASGSLTQDQATAFMTGYSAETLALAKTTDVSMIEKTFLNISSNTRYEFNRKGVNLPLRAVGNSNCRPSQSPTQLVDADGDSIPVFATYEFGCNYTENGFNLEASGSATVSDQNDTNAGSVFPKAGYSTKMEDFLLKVSVGATDIRTTLNGTYDLGVSGGTHTAKSSLQVKTESGSVTGNAGYWIDVVNVATDVANIAGGGTSSMSGYFQLVMGNNDYTLRINSKDLTYGGCGADNFFKNGEITFTDGDENVLRLTYTNCVRRVTYNETATL